MVQDEQHHKLRDDLVVSQQEVDGQIFFMLKDPITFKFFRVREPEYYLISQFDGHSSYDDVARRFQEKFNLNVPVEAVAKFAEKIDSLYFFEGARAEYETSASRYKSQTKESLFSRILFVKLKAFNPDPLLDKLNKPLFFLFQPWAVALMIIYILAGFFAYSLNFHDFRFTLGDLFNVTSIVTIFLSMAVIIIIHEFAHAMTCRHFGGQVREMGFLLLYFQICFYSNLSDSWLFKHKSQRLAVIWAGLFFQMVLFATAVFGWRVTVIGTGINDFFWLVSNVCFVMLLINVNPLIKLDGYYLLSEITNIPNLRSRAFGYMSYLVRKAISLDVESPRATGREKRIFFVYTIFAGFYSIFLIVYMATILYDFLITYLGGFGFVLFLAILVLIFKTPVVTAVKFILSREVLRAMATKPRNLIIWGIVLIGAVVLLFFIPMPHQVGGDVVISPYAEYNIYHLAEQARLELTLRKGGKSREFSSEHILLSTGDLAVLKLIPLVKEGDMVKAGDTLATIVSSQVSTGLDGAYAELRRLKNQIALAKAPPKPEEVETATAAVNAARSSVEQLQKDIDRNKSLYEKKLISKQELEKSESDLALAQSLLEEARARLRLVKAPPKPEEIDVLESQIANQQARVDYLLEQQDAQAIVSPIGGQVVAYYRDNLLLKIADMSKVEVAIPIMDNFLEYVTEDAQVNVKVRTYAARIFSGQVTQISGSAAVARFGDNRARFPVYAVLDNTDRLLKDGMSGYAKISCGDASLFNIIFNRIKAYIRVEFWSWW
ncbi:MAG: efflux RND transporter periplasmic adaptor subunit [Candidatus Zixiibacteriota bacterium]